MKCELEHLDWSGELECGIQDIDRQHQYLLKLLKDMSENLLIPGDSELFSKMLFEFNEVVIKHFDFEEALLEKLGYEYLEEHQQQHERILQQLADVSMTATFNTKEAPKEFIDTLCDWFEQHLSEEDTQYFGTLKTSLIQG